jgi:hypothetical protein
MVHNLHFELKLAWQRTTHALTPSTAPFQAPTMTSPPEKRLRCQANSRENDQKQGQPFTEPHSLSSDKPGATKQHQAHIDDEEPEKQQRAGLRTFADVAQLGQGGQRVALSDLSFNIDVLPCISPNSRARAAAATGGVSTLFSPASAAFCWLFVARRQQPVAGNPYPHRFEPTSIPAGPTQSDVPALVHQQQQQLENLAEPPMDWSLKTVLRLSSTGPLSVCEEVASASGSDQAEAMLAFVSRSGLAELTQPQAMLAALMSFQYPLDPRPPVTQWAGAGPGAPGGGSGGSSKLSTSGSFSAAAEAKEATGGEQRRRRQEWQSAFSSLYGAFRNGHCAAFYCVSPEGSKQPFVALFAAAGVGGHRRIHALLTRSTPGLRTRLREGLGLHFREPLQRQGGADGGTSSLLCFEGAQRVHGLFDFLLDEGLRMHGAAADVPLLLAPTAFAYAAVVAARLDSLPRSQAGRHRVEVRGCPLLPGWVVDRVVGVLARVQQSGFAMGAEVHPLCLAINWCERAREEDSEAACKGHRDAGLMDPQAQRRGCMSAGEAARWADRGLGALREVQCGECGRFAVIVAR